MPTSELPTPYATLRDFARYAGAAGQPKLRTWAACADGVPAAQGSIHTVH
jgi:hypothetical protein